MINLNAIWAMLIEGVRSPRSAGESASQSMKLAGFLLALAGWTIVLAAVVLLEASAPRGGFAVAGMAVQFLGLGLAARAHLGNRGGNT